MHLSWCSECSGVGFSPRPQPRGEEEASPAELRPRWEPGFVCQRRYQHLPLSHPGSPHARHPRPGLVAMC